MTVPAGWVRGVSVTGLGAAFLTAITVQAAAIAQSWGSRYWAPGCAFAAAVCLAALAGLRRPLWPAAAGLVL
ncbi:sensor histidine kinase, partial [Actinomadura bangladeshensis]|nr:sensor histidine kinase [Actinomadura bangladeshensis]